MFWICLLCLIAGIGAGSGIAQIFTTHLLADRDKYWISALMELGKIDEQTVDVDAQVFENVTVVANGDDICWYRQNNTVEMTYEDWEKKHNNTKNN